MNIRVKQTLVCILSLHFLFLYSSFLSASDSETIEADPLLKSERWFTSLNLEPVWKEATGKGVVIAACAAGFFEEEESLQENYLLEHKYDLSDQDQPLKIDDGKYVFQGTSIASIMVGSLDGEDSNGLAFNAKLVPLQNYNYQVDLDDLDKESATAACVLRAITINQVNIIVIASQSRHGSSEAESKTRMAVKQAVAAGIIVVTAAGDHSRLLSIEKNDDSGSIIVGSLRQNSSASNFSNFGGRVTVSAIGEGVRTVGGPFGQLRTIGGTVASAAQIAGIIALALELKPHISPYQIRSLILKTSKTTISNASVGGLMHVQSFINGVKKLKVSDSLWQNSQNYRSLLSEKILAPH
jgi:hypothetical protein